MKKSYKDENMITIEEDVRIPGTDVLLEKGDKIEILNEGNRMAGKMLIVEFEGRMDTYTIWASFRQGEVTEITNGTGEDVMQVGPDRPEEPGLYKMIDVVNALMSPRVISIDVS